jgi:hypothetical protein
MLTPEECDLIALCDKSGQVMPSHCGTPLARGLVEKGFLEYRDVILFEHPCPWETLTPNGQKAFAEIMNAKASE